MPSDGSAPLQQLLALADQVINCKPGLRDECMRAKSEDVAVEDLLGPDNVDMLHHMRSIR